MSGEISLEPVGVKILFVFSVINNYQQAARFAWKRRILLHRLGSE